MPTGCVKTGQCPRLVRGIHVFLVVTLPLVVTLLRAFRAQIPQFWKVDAFLSFSYIGWVDSWNWS